MQWVPLSTIAACGNTDIDKDGQHISTSFHITMKPKALPSSAGDTSEGINCLPKCEQMNGPDIPPIFDSIK